MTGKLFCQAIIKFITGILIVGVLLFLPAGTFAYRQAWLLLAVLFLPMFFSGIVMMLKDPELLRKRLNANEKETEQKQVIALSGIMFLAAFMIAGLNIRFGLLILPAWLSYTAAIIFLAAYVLYAEVLRENRYLSRTIEIQEDQKVIDTGLYGIVRHPMYTATLFLFLSMPLILGSVFSFLILLLYIPITRKRIQNEEKVLEQGLKGYPEYEKKVKYRMIPYIW
ncbi:MAG: isoprenylcysteine carboxylmethyltransferase family protein [Lachnospiraceae bacterium]|nr:isoprenylcysteine carboxylmethyltransferase family protein [Lachnospiraceae bacterium]MCM1239067.1 isoprenylcysteine carboxylmethyltransferase family protein [Lachnospiraceae bacterium]